MRKKVGCPSYEKTGQVVGGGNGYGPALNQFFTNRFYVDDSKNIYLLNRFATYTCDWRFLLWPKNGSQGSLISNACINGASSSLQDVLMSPDGKYKITGLGFGTDVVSQVRRVNGQNGFMLWSEAIVDNDKNIYASGYSTSNHVCEMRKWTPADNSLQGGILIDSTQSGWGISAFFIDSKGSVYTVGPGYIGVMKWTDGKSTYITRNPKLNHPTSVLVDDEENIYIGEMNQITLWPAKSNESFPVVTINQTNGLLLDNNYKNIIQMDNNGSLYLLSTDRAVFGTKILQYQCQSKKKSSCITNCDRSFNLFLIDCSTCIKNNRFSALSYNGAYGPTYMGNIKLAEYAKWSELIKSGKATENEKVIISGMAVNEGNLDSVQSYDSPIVSAGAMQKTLGDSGGGEFEVQVYEFKHENPQVYDEQFEKCGWSISSKKLMSFKGKTGSTLKKYLRDGFKKGSNDISEALGPLVCAISTPEFQLKQVKDFITRLRTVLTKFPKGYSYTIADYFQSRLGQATALDQHVNRPAGLEVDVGTALNNFYKNHNDAPKNPKVWTAQQRSAYEREILQDYGVNRQMSDPVNRYERLKTKLPLP